MIEGEQKIIGIDIGGSHISGGEVLLNKRHVCPGSQKRIRIDASGSSDYIIHSWSDFISQYVDHGNSDQVRIGIAMPGPFDYSAGISYIKDLNKYDALYGVNVKERLAMALDIPEEHILFRNDAEAFLHGEVVHRPELTLTKVVGVTLGTGLGSAVFSQGVSWDVFRAITPMKQGIAEEYISSRWFMHRYRELSGRQLESVETLAKGDDPLKEKLFNEFATHLALFLDGFTQEESASTVIIGGNIARCMHLFVEELKIKMTNKDVNLCQSMLWEDAALLGAACLWDNDRSV